MASNEKNKNTYLDGETFDTKYYDWTCSKCNILVFGRNECCRKCFTRNPSLPVDLHGKIGSEHRSIHYSIHYSDWICPQCNFKIFGSKSECKKCHSKRPI